jgi:hypothetical protein
MVALYAMILLAQPQPDAIVAQYETLHKFGSILTRQVRLAFKNNPGNMRDVSLVCHLMMYCRFPVVAKWMACGFLASKSAI